MTIFSQETQLDRQTHRRTVSIDAVPVGGSIGSDPFFLESSRWRWRCCFFSEGQLLKGNSLLIYLQARQRLCERASQTLAHSLARSVSRSVSHEEASKSGKREELFLRRAVRKPSVPCSTPFYTYAS